MIYLAIKKMMPFILLLFLPLELNGSSAHKDSEIPLELIIEVNHFTYTIANEHDQFHSFIGVRALTMVHLVIHDILNSSEEVYSRYLSLDQFHGGEKLPAVCAGVKRILINAYPERLDTINTFFKSWEQKYPAKHLESILFGQLVADHLIALRNNDGHKRNGDYTPMTKPGDYQYTPGFDWVWKPDFSVARPFTLDSISQFRSPPPPDLNSTVYTQSFTEVVEIGGKESAVRTSDQTHIGHWWAEFGEHSWNRIGRLAARKYDMEANRANRMLALINMALYDLYLVSFDSKYQYDTWRPITAIQNADKDPNVNTHVNKSWQPEMVTPPWPEYPSAHAAVGMLGATIVSDILESDEFEFTMASVTAPNDRPYRSYQSLLNAAEDCADSRIYNGYHFRFATEEGKRQGKKVAEFVLSKVLVPIAK